VLRLFLLRYTSSAMVCTNISLFFILMSSPLCAQVKWDGEGGDGRWNNPLNWSGNTIPGVTDDVLLDNSFVTGNYNVDIPAGASTVVIKTLSIEPVLPAIIQLTVATGNVAIPALHVTGPGNGISIHDGGVFINASSLTAGATIDVPDSLRIYNGGYYRHATRSAHASLVNVLSKAPGTELGTFEFDVPGGPYTFAATNRTYGILKFSATASGGSQVYNTIGGGALTINGDLVIQNGVTINIDLTNNIYVNRHFIQYGGIVNLASQPNATVLYIKGDIEQQAGTITETSSGLPAIELRGNSHQYLKLDGNILNSVSFRLNNSNGATLRSNVLLPFNLTLVSGNITANGFLLTLLAGCSLTTDSATGNSFINGRLRKEGLAGSPFFFPVGKGTTRRWLAMKNVTGSATVEFFPANPRLIESSLGTGIDHISGMEYWTIETDAMSTARVELSFDNVNSGGVTGLSSLRVANLVGNRWENAGNTMTTGAVGIGSVMSDDVILNTAGGAKYFTLASSEPAQNPLPQRLLSFSARAVDKGILFNWKVPVNFQAAYYELEQSVGEEKFATVARLDALAGLYQYTFQYSTDVNQSIWRLKVVDRDGVVSYSKLVNTAVVMGHKGVSLWPSIAHDKATLLINANEKHVACVDVYDVNGCLLFKINSNLNAGHNYIALDLSRLRAGMYVLSVTNGKEIDIVKFVKQ